ncbi:MAG: hypothetical protein A2252_01560 [Elusimicrobia bacterium RIFOXYA2_FULL_39_19]|nr:MAG: hypothetical protein A2252_01560 [Elusimicrobia bacterium RIFOXYA2_FULL_39_19]
MKKYILAGTGSRGVNMFAKPILQQFSKTAVLAGMFDSSIGRLNGAKKVLGTEIPCYTNYDKMLKELDFDTAIICTIDSTHEDYILKSMQAGKNVITEKPLCINAKQCKTILKASKKSKRKIIITHNVRYSPAMIEIKKIVDKGIIGRVLTVEFNENLNRQHGSDYFRRWHRHKKNSGGLLVHKACHCFDIINWIVGSKPEKVTAEGGLVVYGKNGKFRSERCLGCKTSSKCDFFVDLFSNSAMRALYLEAEKEKNAYIRDGCVYDESIDIEDVANVAYTYENGVRVNFSLSTFASYEGYDMIVEGTKGRMVYSTIYETDCYSGKTRIPGAEKKAGEKLQLFLLNQSVTDIKIPKVDGSHGGADILLLQDLFGNKENSDLATIEEAIDAVLIGDAANKSLKTGKTVSIKEIY